MTFVIGSAPPICTLHNPLFPPFFCIYVISLFEDVKCCGKKCEAKLTFIHTRYLIFLLGTLTVSFVLHFLLISQGNVMLLTWINFPCHIPFSVCKFSSFIFLECHFGAVVCNCSNSLLFNSSSRYFSDPSGYWEWNGIMMGMLAWEPFTSLDTTLIFTWLTQMYVVLICYTGQR